MAKFLSLRGISKIIFQAVNHLSTVSLTQQEVANALRPFYFAVHPDLFYQFPKEKEINENSLKQLTFYLEMILKNTPASPVSLTFCLKKVPQNVNHSVSFRRVMVRLSDRDLHRTLRHLLSTCDLPTDYVDALHKNRTPDRKKLVHREVDLSQDFHPHWFREVYTQRYVRDVEEEIRNEPDTDLSVWLQSQSELAWRRMKASGPLLEEAGRLCGQLKESLGLRDLVWDCGWGVTHFRGGLQSFKGLTLQHPDILPILKGRTVVFGSQTGVSFEGHIILSSEDVRDNWLEMIKSVDEFDSLLRQIPESERHLSEVLRGMRIGQRKFRPSLMVQKYMQQLGKLTSALYRHWWRHGYPESWPRRMQEYQMVVECEAGPLMLTPTGQFITPSSCPASVLIDFISRNRTEAKHRIQRYQTMKSEEVLVHARCLSELGLHSLEKDDDITPDRMVSCCQRMLRLRPNVRGLRLRISHHYSVLQDGVMCLPWNWTDMGC